MNKLLYCTCGEILKKDEVTWLGPMTFENIRLELFNCGQCGSTGAIKFIDGKEIYDCKKQERAHRSQRKVR